MNQSHTGATSLEGQQSRRARPSEKELTGLFDELIELIRLGMELSLVAAICRKSWDRARETGDADEGESTLRILVYFNRHGVHLLRIGAHPVFFRRQIQAMAEAEATSWATSRGSEPGQAAAVMAAELRERYERQLDQDPFPLLYRLEADIERMAPPPPDHPAHHLGWVRDQIAAFSRAQSAAFLARGSEPIEGIR